MDIIDISRDILSCEVYPGDPKPEAEPIEEISKGAHCNLTVLHTCVHTGTHVDAPLHFIDGGTDIASLPLSPFIGPCTVIEVKSGMITGETIDASFPKHCERLLIKGNSNAFFMDSSAEALADSGTLLVGTDALSVGCHGEQAKTHKAFLSNGVNILEGLDLTDVAPGNYFLFAPPIKTGGIEGAPCRAILVNDYIFWSKKSN